MLDLSYLSSWVGVISTIGGVGGYAYNKYRTIAQAINDRPSKTEVGDIVRVETDKINLKIDNVDKRVENLHQDLADLRDIIIQNAWTSSQNSQRANQSSNSSSAETPSRKTP